MVDPDCKFDKTLKILTFEILPTRFTTLYITVARVIIALLLSSVDDNIAQHVLLLNVSNINSGQLHELYVTLTTVFYIVSKNRLSDMKLRSKNEQHLISQIIRTGA